ncbi:hypothetical protein J0K78_04995 [Halobacillus sp. GSS1]|uniref:hypothetical protein n=1 Tax=Halobacillus sp. GSS1 TaxID=2815919 RepID=UPI001A8C8022|nr:hypothetical protein [Halobacillus sp. GSS1]MBN9653617.1 hypothetical protein [Halobacillus sp. GSS1]
MSHKGLIQKLNFIEKRLLSNEYHEQKPIITAKISDIYSELKGKTYKHRGVLYSRQSPQNVSVYKAWIKAGKYKALSDLQELQTEISNGKTKRSLAIIQRLKQSDFHQKEVTATIEGFKGKGRTTHKTVLTQI